MVYVGAGVDGANIQQEVVKLEMIKRVTELDMQSVPTGQGIVDRLAALVNPIGVGIAALTSKVKNINFTPNFLFNSKTEEEAIKNVNFITISKVYLNVPEGLDIKLHAYLELLDEAATHTDGIIDECLIPFKHFVADIVSNKASMASASKYSMVQNKLAVPREKLNGLFGKAFKKGSYNAQKQFGQVFGNMREYLMCIDICEELNVWQGRIKTKELFKHLDEINEVCEALLDMVDKGHVEEASKANLKHLSDAAFQLGKELEFLAVLIFRIQTVGATMNQARMIVKG